MPAHQILCSVCVCVSVGTRTGGVGFILVVSAVVIPVTQPAQRDAAVVLALKSVGGASVLVCEGRITKTGCVQGREGDGGK